MIDNTPNEAARRGRLETLYEGKSCARCGETDIEMIGCYSRIDLHHLAGRCHDPKLVVYLCRNCHALAHAYMKEMGFDLSPPPCRNLLEVLIAVLAAMGRTFQDWGTQLLSYAEQLVALVATLDVECPDWRSLPEAQS